VFVAPAAACYPVAVLAQSRLWREIERSSVDVKNVSALVHGVLSIQQRRAKLLGLDAPQQIDVSVLKPATDQKWE
jgi:hypothetical protein